MPEDNSSKFGHSSRCLYHRAAQKELLYSLSVAVFPLLAAYAGIWLSDNASSFWGAWLKAIGNGELILISAGLMAPVFYSTQKEKPVNNKDWYVFICLAFIAFGGFYNFAYTLGIIEKDLFVYSMAIAAIAILVLYSNLVYTHRAEMGRSAPELQQDATEKFRTDFRDFMGGNQ